MSQLTNTKFSTDQVMMTLSAISYSAYDTISGLQESLNDAPALEHSYLAVWWGKNEKNNVYVIKNRQTEDYCIVMRGPVFQLGLSLLLNLYEELDVAHLTSMPFSRLGDARVSGGILEMIQDINDLTYTGRTLQQLINNLPRGTSVFVTGHSLGGTIAATYAAKLACSNLVDLTIIPYTFAAPAAGNQAFADLLDPGHVNYLFTRSSRCVSNLDIIPNAWHNLQAMLTIDYGQIKCPVEFTICVDCVERLLILSRVFYVQPPLTLDLLSECELNDDFFHEAMHQHQHNTYLSLLGLGPISSGAYSYKDRKEIMLTSSL